MKPVIGITTDVGKKNSQVLNYSYVTAVQRAGGIPMIIPVGSEDDVLQMGTLFDGLLASGGNDVNPFFFGEEPHQNLGEVSPTRDSVEINLIQEMLKLDKPILGICRGIQVLNVAVGGNMYQDIYSQHEKPILQHAQKAPKGHLSHFVQVAKDSLLESISLSRQLKVNSYHHQSVKDVPEPLKITGVASDGIIEAIESTKHRFVIGVQWHPEELAAIGDENALRLFEKFVEACIERGAVN